VWLFYTHTKAFYCDRKARASRYFEANPDLVVFAACTALKAVAGKNEVQINLQKVTPLALFVDANAFSGKVQ
jgi:hypothetical protein